MPRLSRKKLVRPTLLQLLTLEDRSVPATISGTVFNDVDADGIIDAGEAGQSGVTIYNDANGNSVLDAGSPTTVSSLNVPVTIAATGTPTITSTLSVAGMGTIIDVNVKLSITHSYDSDLSIFITSPAGTKIDLSSGNGGSSNNYTNTVFDDEGTTSVTAGTAPFTGTYKPEGLLSGFDGQTANGTWTLTVVDGADADGGSLTAWSVILTTSSESTVVSGAGGTFTFSSLAAGTYTLRQLAPPSGQSQTFPVSNGAQVVTVAAADAKTGINFGNRQAPAMISGTAYSDTDADGVFDAGESVLSNVTVFLDTNQNGLLGAGEISTVTNASGVYTFNGVAPGNYFVAAVTPAGGTLTAPIRNGLTVLPPVNTTKRAGEDNEPTVVVDPVNPQRMFMSSNGGAGINGSYSTNGGATWTNRVMPAGGDTGIANTFCDANTAADQWGNLWLTYLTDNVTTSLARSTDGGASFTFIQDFGSSDHPSIAIGPSATPGQQTLAFQDASGGIRVFMAQINANGVVGSVQGPVVAPSSSGFNYGDMVVGPNGQVGVTYMNSGGQGPGNLYFNLDPDGTGPLPMGAQSVITSTNVGGFDYIPAQPDRSVDAEPDLVWDTSGGPYNGRLYLVYTDEIVDEAHDMDTFIRYSTNNGATWSNRIRVNDDVGTNSQFLPRVAMERETGYLAVGFYDSRNSPGNNTADYYATASFDGGITWQPNAKLTQAMSSSVGGGGNDFGDYTDIDYVQGRIVAVYADSSNSTGDNPSGVGSQDVYASRVDVANNVKNHYVVAIAATSYGNLNFGFSGVAATPAAKVSAATFNPGTTQRSRVESLQVTFNQIVTAPLAAFTLTRQGSGEVVPLSLTNTDVTGGFTVLTFGFTGGPVLFNSLIDGRYTLTINSSLVSNANGVLDGDGNGTAGGNYTLAGDSTNKLFRFFGDFDANGTVDATDFSFFPNFGAAVNSAFDFNNNSDIDGGTDFAQFGNRVGYSI